MMSNQEMGREFELYAHKHLGLSSQLVSDYSKMVSSSAVAEGYISPTIIEERQMNVAQMDVFSRLMMDRIIFLGSGINDYVANVVQAQLLFLETSDPGKDISIYINSPGGSVYAGFGIYDTMQYVGCDVSTMCTGMAASMAAVLLVAGAEGKRYALPHSRVMIHQPMGGMQGQASDIEIAAKEILKVKAELYKIIADHSGRSVEDIERDSDRDKWMTAAEALEYGMIDKVLVSSKQAAKDKKADGKEK
ncbi:ATP-dependent Clp endopeptidase proteolytic subunit ClpP [uncultured Porphyromonas sp.]|uniref:ATP-dependent Clp endopeptidase proteolytic subunit ClpP n=1 Tax=uncultured Porphyromonas sp. TaxID=159274 RepID=UPI00258C7F1E|nr:ATP-dependent Clp endopeptidase proteolytic subunit ClpP [uncultured Porphyromonas sp.]